MGVHRRHEEEKVCPLCIEVLDATEKSFYPCPCGYQVCLFCFDRLKNDCGNLCPGCRTEYGSANNPFAKRKSSNSGTAAVAPASESSRSSSPVAAPPAAAATHPAAASAAGDAAGGTAGLSPLQQARQMHRAKLAAAQQAGAQQQPAAQHSTSFPVVSRPQAAQSAQSTAPPPPPPQQTQHQHQHQQSRLGGTVSRQRSGTLESPRQRQHQHMHSQPHAAAQRQAAQQAPPPQLSLPSLQDVSLQPQTSLGSARPGWVQGQLLPPPLPPPGSRGPGVGTSASMAFDAPLGSAPQQQPAQWLAPGSGAPFGGSHAPATANGVRATDGLFASANGTGDSPWGSDLGGRSAFAQPQRRTAVPPRPLPLEGGPEVKAEPGAEADLAAARLAVQCGQVSASDAAWNLLAARASVRAV